MMQDNAIQNGIEQFTGLPTYNQASPHPQHTFITHTWLTFCKFMVTAGIVKPPQLYIQKHKCYFHHIFQRNNHFRNILGQDEYFWLTCGKSALQITVHAVCMGEFLDQKK